ncbi:MAG: carbohydrate-binding domain-containing protein [Lachnospiraceae bacterium]|nr:carbohydrate-binding domain-containing protein [Lachnospiraceae bacterium]
MKKQILAGLLALALLASGTACAANTGTAAGTQRTQTETADTGSAGTVTGTETGTGSGTGAEAGTGTLSTEYFSDGDVKDVTGETPDAAITLAGSTGTLSDDTRGSSGSTVTITSKGIYYVTGASEDVSIVIDDGNESGNVYLILDSVTMTNGSRPCIIVEAADKVVIQCVGESTLTYSAKNTEYDGAIYAKDDLTVNGTGTLNIVSTLHGIVGNDDLKITGSVLNVEAGSSGIKANESVRIGGGEITVSSGKDGVHVGNDDEEGDFYMEAGTLTVTAGDDGVHADKDLTVAGGTLTVLKSYEGLEAYEVNIDGGTVTVYASDDGINAAGGSDTASTGFFPGFWGAGTGSGSGTLNISGGTVYVNAGGDGLDSNGSLYVSGGLVIVEGPTNNGNGALDIGDGNGCVASITGGTVLALGSSGMAVNFNSGSQCSALLSLSGSAGTTVTVNDGSGFSFTASKAFTSVVYSSSAMTKGQTYTVSAGTGSASADFSSGLYYSQGGSMGMGMTPGGMQGGRH